MKDFKKLIVNGQEQPAGKKAKLGDKLTKEQIEELLRSKKPG